VTEQPASVAVALAIARARGIARLDAQLMLAHLMAATRSWLIAHDDARLDPKVAARWAQWLKRRAAGEPLAYLLGEKEFRGLMLEVTPAVLVPRPETELLVDWADTLLRDGTGRQAVVDLGTGSGAIALAVKHEHPHARVLATDTSAAALAVARGNAGRLSLELEFVETSWWQGLDGRRFDLALANPPYVAETDPALQALRHEPIAALTPGGDGLVAIATIIAAAPDHLSANGWLLLEHGFDQGESVRRLLTRAGLANVETRRDLAGLARVTGAQRSEATA
jgi:release factor glutamine methyltransferase